MDEKFNRIPVSVIHLDKDGTVTDVEDSFCGECSRRRFKSHGESTSELKNSPSNWTGCFQMSCVTNLDTR